MLLHFRIMEFDMNECVPKQFSEIRSGDQYRSKKHEAIAYCVRCGLCETVNESLIGQRFDCPRGAFDETHVAAVVFDKFWEVAWLRIAHWLALCEECRADLWRHNIELSIAVAIALPIFFYGFFGFSKLRDFVLYGWAEQPRPG